VAFESKGGEAVDEDDGEAGGGRRCGPHLRIDGWGTLPEGGDGGGVEGAAEVGAAEVGASLGGVGLDEKRLEVAGLEAADEEGGVEGGVDGVAGQGVVELEAEVVLRGEVWAGVGLPAEMKGEAGGGGWRWCWAGWGVVGHLQECRLRFEIRGGRG
jgi:hypothetical protein